MSKESVYKLAVAGAAGRMGKAVLEAQAHHSRLKLVAAWEHRGSAVVGSDVGQLAGGGLRGVFVTDQAQEAIQHADVVVDFTTPASSLEHLKLAKNHGTAMVIGATGWTAAQEAKFRQLSRQVPVVRATNFSIGVNVLNKAAADVARLTGDDYDVEIIDVHHHLKKDTPSGTGDTLARIIAGARGHDPKKVVKTGRPEGVQQSRKRGDVYIHALRVGDVVGDHTAVFAGPWERIELVHRSHDRKNFANGALTAAIWLMTKRRGPGAYSMAQVLGLEG